jgi:hypothetical protein
MVGIATYSLEARLVRHNTTVIQEGHTVAYISSPDGSVVRQIYSHEWGDSDPLNYVSILFSGATGRIVVRWAVEHSCKHRGLCVAHSSQPCEIYIPPGAAIPGTFLFIVDTLDKDVRFHIALERSRAPLNPFSNATEAIKLNTLYRYNLFFGKPVVIRADLSPQNVSDTNVVFLLDYVKGGEIEAWAIRGSLGEYSKRRLLCRSEHQSIDKCRLELPRCPEPNQKLAGPWCMPLTSF